MVCQQITSKTPKNHTIKNITFLIGCRISYIPYNHIIPKYFIKRSSLPQQTLTNI